MRSFGNVHLIVMHIYPHYSEKTHKFIMQTRTTSRPRLTPAILAFAVVDVAGMVLFATGAMWFAHGTPLFIPNYPNDPFEAGVALAGGLLLMVWAAARILRELLKQTAGKNGEQSQ